MSDIDELDELCLNFILVTFKKKKYYLIQYMKNTQHMAEIQYIAINGFFFVYLIIIYKWCRAGSVSGKVMIFHFCFFSYVQTLPQLNK